MKDSYTVFLKRQYIQNKKAFTTPLGSKFKYHFIYSLSAYVNKRGEH